jgi:hypothetical protein
MSLSFSSLPERINLKLRLTTDTHACAPKRCSAQARIYTDKGKKLSVFAKHKEAFKV